MMDTECVTEPTVPYAGSHVLVLDRRQGTALVTVIMAGLEELAGQTSAADDSDAVADALAGMPAQIEIVEHLLADIMEAFPTYYPPGAPRTLDLPLVFQ